MATLEQIKNNAVYQEVLKDSFGGVIYNVANRDKYNASEVIELWNDLSDNDQELAGGIMKGAVDFLQGAI